MINYELIDIDFDNIINFEITTDVCNQSQFSFLLNSDEENQQ